VVYYSYAELIEMVLERYAKIYGILEGQRLIELEYRLAQKYCNGHHATLKALTPNGYKKTYPKKSWHEIAMEKMLDWEYENPSGAYCELFPSGKDLNINGYIRKSSCDCCGRHLMQRLPNKNMNNGYGLLIGGISLNGWRVCLDKRCRCIAALFSPTRRNCKEALIKIIEEVIKNGGDNETRKKLEKHFI
jgi:hypothetical protein